MRTVSISQLWSRAWDLFKGNWLLLVGLLVLCSVLPFLWPALVQAGYLVARQGQSSFGEAFRGIGRLLKVLIYQFILLLIGGSLIGMGFVLAPDSAQGVVVGSILGFIITLFGWAGPYAILSGRAGIFGAIGQSFSLTGQNFGKVFLALLSYIGLAILGSLLCGVGLLVVSLMSYVFWPLLYLALTGEEGVSHS
jgi:hypothetical protein